LAWYSWMFMFGVFWRAETRLRGLVGQAESKKSPNHQPAKQNSPTYDFFPKSP